MPQTTTSNWTWHLQHDEHGNKPWAVQAEALTRAGDRRGFAWFLEQGLGKTSLAFNDFVDKFERDLCDMMLVIAPNSFTGDWAATPQEWGYDTPAWAWKSTRKHKLPPLPEPGTAFVVSVNFEAVRLKSAHLGRFLKMCKEYRVYLCVDESLAIANFNSEISKGVREICKVAEFVRELNGTPRARDVMDLYPQLRAIGECDGVNPYQFRNRYARLGGYMGKQIVGDNEDRALELAKILDRCSFRALKADWRKDLPPKILTEVKVSMTGRQLDHYQEMLQEFYTCIEGFDVDAQMVLTQMDKLRQIAAGLAMQNGEHTWIMPAKNNPKLQATADIYEGGTSKMIVSYFYRPVGDALLELFAKADPAVIRGGMTSAELADNKARFNKSRGCRIMVAQQGAAFRGHTLIGTQGDRASRMVFFENAFSYYQRSQMEDRIHRGAQDEDCQYWDLVASSIDTKSIANLRKKGDEAATMDKIVAEVQQAKRNGTLRVY